MQLNSSQELYSKKITNKFHNKMKKKKSNFNNVF